MASIERLGSTPHTAAKTEPPEPEAPGAPRAPSGLPEPDLPPASGDARSPSLVDGLPEGRIVSQLLPSGQDIDIRQSLRNLLSNTGAVVFDSFNVYMGNDTEGMNGVSGFDPVRQAEVHIQMREVEGLPDTVPSSELDRAAGEKAQDDREHTDALRAYNRENGTNYRNLREWSEGLGFYGSTNHHTWAAAAEARTGGRIPASWWQETFPFGGAAGGGPNILESGNRVIDQLLGGEYPGSLARIGIAHDTDWALGRYFGVGPLSALDGAPIPDTGVPPQVRLSRGKPRVVGDFPLGYVGLFPVGDARYDGIDSYVDGHPDWNVQFYD